MKSTIKISIAGYAFCLEEDAYRKLEIYLDTLNEYFKDKEDGEEIVMDVEIRISELLRLKIDKGQERVITLRDMEETIGMIGSPKEMLDSDDLTSKEESTECKKEFNFKKKKLFRDKEHSILGGVCSGLGQYLNVDPVIIRGVYILAFVLLGFISGDIRTFLAGVYIVLWIAMPKAKTMRQKIEMIGTDPSIDNIENREGRSFARKKDSVLAKLVKICAGIVLGIICFSLLLSVIAIVAVFFGISAIEDIPTISAVLNVFSINSASVQWCLILVCVLPIIALLYWCCKLLFLFRFTKKDLIISLIGFFVWIGIACYLGGYIAVYAKNLSSEFTMVESIPVNTNSDNIYIEIGDDYQNLKPLYWVSDQKNSLNHALMYYQKNNEGKYSFVILPKIVVKEDLSLDSVVVNIEKEVFSDTYENAVSKAENINLNYTVKDSLLIVNPVMYSKQNPWDGVVYKLVIQVPEGKSIQSKGLPFKYRNIISK